MIPYDSKNDCCGCGACRSVCPEGCIEMVPDSEGFLYPIIDSSECTDCGSCRNTCPMLKEPFQGSPPLAFAAWNLDPITRSGSSSGGVFSSLMQIIFRQNGIVIGAAFDESLKLSHKAATSMADGCLFRGSKYLQSDIGDCYQIAKDHLLKDRSVLFTGTPCQIAGLYAFLGKNHEKLLTCDVVCHGVPSPKVFDAYRHTLEQRYDSKVKSATFRRKEPGWKHYSVVFTFENGTEYKRVLTEDPFMIGFLRDIFLRPACHGCRFSRLPRIADISLGDFWGVGVHHPEWDDDQGTSLVLVQTQKGLQAIEECNEFLVMHKADLQMAIAANPCISRPVPANRKRTAFFRDYNSLPFEDLLKKYTSPVPLWRSVASRSKYMLLQIIRRSMATSSSI